MHTVRPVRARIAENDSGQPASAMTPLVIATRIFNVVVPLTFIIFAWHHAAAFIQTLRISNVIILTYVVLHLQFYVRKYTGPFVSTSAYAWLVALGGTVAPLLFRPAADDSDFPVGLAMQVAAATMQIFLISTLSQGCESNLARRGISRDGLYRFVRHPLYMTYLFSQYGYVLNHSTFYNLFICALAIFFQVLRINEEERLLLSDEEFQAYVEQTRWRLIPGVF